MFKIQLYMRLQVMVSSNAINKDLSGLVNKKKQRLFQLE